MINQVIVGCLLMLLLASVPCFSNENRPSVLFYGGVHSKYVGNPLVEMGIEVDSASSDLAQKLETGRYDVVVIGTLNESDRNAVDEFMSRGGGVLVCNPQVPWDDAANSTATNHWLTELGARPRWEVLQDDHKPPTPTSMWSGLVEYTRTTLLPVWQPRDKCTIDVTLSEGEYSIHAGLYDKEKGRKLLDAGPGVAAVDGEAYKIGTLSIK